MAIRCPKCRAPIGAFRVKGNVFACPQCRVPLEANIQLSILLAFGIAAAAAWLFHSLATDWHWCKSTEICSDISDAMAMIFLLVGPAFIWPLLAHLGILKINLPKSRLR